MNYDVTDNRIVIDNYFIEQDTTGNIHIYRRGTMEHIESINHNRVLSEKEFKKICDDYINNLEEE